MKKLILIIILFMPMFVSASSIKNLEVLNGTLSREFESTNNIYSIILNEGAKELLLNYELEDDTSSVETSGFSYIEGEENIAVITVSNSDGTNETYTFYLETSEAISVFNEISKEEEQTEIPYLKYYVGGGCLLIILFLFKVIVLGFK